MSVHVLHVIASLYGGGGAEKHLLSLAQSMDRNQFDLSVAYLQPYHNLVDAFNQLGIPTYPLFVDRWLSPKSLAKLVSILRQGNYDIVHSHLYPADVYTWAALHLAPGPIWISSHHNEPPFFKHPLHCRMSQMIYRQARSLIAISGSVKEYIHSTCGINSEKVQVIHYGLDDNCFLVNNGADSGSIAKTALGLNEDNFIVTIIARLTPQKGHQYAIRALEQIVATHPHIRFLVVGEGPLESHLRQMVETLSLTKHVRFLGLRKDVPDILKISDLLLLPSLYEGFGLVLLEAMATKKPVLASKVGPIPEVVVDGGTGLLVPPADSQAIAEAILKLDHDVTLRLNLGKAGYERLKDHFTLEKMARKIEELYLRELGYETTPSVLLSYNSR